MPSPNLVRAGAFGGADGGGHPEFVNRVRRGQRYAPRGLRPPRPRRREEQSHFGFVFLVAFVPSSSLVRTSPSSPQTRRQFTPSHRLRGASTSPPGPST